MSPPTNPYPGRASTGSLIAEPENLCWALIGIYAMVVALDRSVGLGVQWLTDGPTSLLAGAIEVAMTAIVLFAARFTYLRAAWCRRHASVMVLTMFLAVIFGAVGADAVQTIASPPDASDDISLGFDRVVFGTVVLIVGAWALASLRRFRGAVQDLQSAQIRLSGVQRAGQRELDTERTRVIDPIITRLQALIADFPDQPMGQIAARLREAATQIVRPISHALQNDTQAFEPPAPEPVPRIGWSETLREVSARPWIPVNLMALVMTLLTLRLTVASSEASNLPSTTPTATVSADWGSLLQALAQLAAVYGSVWLVARLGARFLDATLTKVGDAARWVIFTFSVIAIAVLAQVLVLLVLSIPALSPRTATSLDGPFVFVLPLAVVVALAGIMRAIQIRREIIIADLETRNRDLTVEIARINEQLWSQRRWLSKTLHGSVQGSLNAAATQLDQASDPDDQSAALLIAENRLNYALLTLSLTHEHDVNVAEELGLIRTTWTGACSVTVNVEAQHLARIQADHNCAAAFVDIVSESVANAVVHGSATEVHVDAALEDSATVHITITDNGTQHAPRNSGGLGSQMLERTCTRWELEVSTEGARLSAELPLS